MPFKKILVALDGSKNSQVAAEYGFWLASKLDAELTGQHVVDPRLVDYFIEPEFAEALGYGMSIETSEKVSSALRKIGRAILDIFSREGVAKGVKATPYLSEGYILEEILRLADDCDLLVVGHRGRYEHKLPARMFLGSISERLARESKTPLLISRQPVGAIEQVLVAFDGSEASIGALLMGENLAKLMNLPLRAVTTIATLEHHAEAQLTMEKGESYLREPESKNVFSILQGETCETVLKEAKEKSLLVIGAYGYAASEQNVLGSTAHSIINHSQSTVLIYRPHISSKITPVSQQGRQVKVG
jgi:nucleotide-binding universal stress UspA family protein